MADTQCVHCGEPVQYNKSITGYKRGVGRYEKPMAHPGWAHHDGMKRDHKAAPLDGRSPEVDMEDRSRRRMAAEEAMHRTLSKQFDHLDMEAKVNDALGGQ